MSSHAAKPAQSKTLTKREVIELLGKSKRTVETYIASGRLPCEYFNGPNGKTASFKTEDVKRLKLENDTPTPCVPRVIEKAKREPRLVAVAERAAAPLALPPAADLAFIFERAREYAQLAPKPWLDVKAAADYSGLPASYLVQAAREGKIRAVNVGKGAREFWRFNREGLSK
jgi:predicted site-specific integrase-resolvase